MKRESSDSVVAIAVIACSLVLLAALTFALTGARFSRPSRTLQIDYEDVTGIKVHSEVRYAGAPAGRVIAMRHLSASERAVSANPRSAVRVKVEVDKGIPPLPGDVVATLSSDTMLGQKFVALSAGTAGRGTLLNNALVEGHPSYGIEQITAAAGPLFENANKLLDNLNSTVTNVNGNLGKVLPKISTLVDSLKDVAKSAESLVSRAVKLIADNEAGLKTDIDDLQVVIKGLDTMTKSAGTLLASADKFVGTTDKQLQEQMKELRVVLQNLKVVSTHAKAITEALGEKPSRLIFSGKANKLTPEAEIIKSKKPLPARVP